MDFEDLLKAISTVIHFKNSRGQDISEDISKAFLELHASLEQSLIRAGMRPRMASSQGAGCSGVEHENLASLTTKVLNLIEAQSVGTDEDRGGKIYEFTEKIKNEIIQAIRQEMEEVANKKDIELVVDGQKRFIK